MAFDLYRFFTEGRNPDAKEQQFFQDREKKQQEELLRAELRRQEINKQAGMQTSGREKFAPNPTPQQNQITPPPPDIMQAPVAGEEIEALPPNRDYASEALAHDRNITSDDLANGYGRQKPILPDLKDRLENSLAEQDRSIGDSESLLRSYLEGSQQADISPMLALLDKTKGQKILGSYKRPVSFDDYAANIGKFQEYLSKGRGNRTDDLIKIAGQKSNDRYLDNLMRQQGREAGQFQNFIKDASKDVNKITGELNQFDSTYDYLTKQFQTLDPNKVSGAMSKFIRFVNEEKGALSEGDVSRAMIPTLTTYFAKLERRLGKDGKMDPKDVQFAIDMINDSRLAQRDRFQGALGSLRDTYTNRAEAQGFGHKMLPGQPSHKMFQIASDRAGKLVRQPSLPGGSAQPAPQGAAPAPAKKPRQLMMNGKVLTEGVDF